MKNAGEIEFWNANAGRKWTQNQKRLDKLFTNVSARLIEIANPTPGMSVLDIGCGTGAIALDLAAKVATHGAVVAVDVSKPMLSLARQRAAELGCSTINFQVADAQEFDLGANRFDLIASRFGVMFFEDPVAAFANVLKSAKPGARTTFAAWSSMDGNPWFKIPLDAAVNRLGKPSPVPATTPGPMAFSDVDYVAGILSKAGYSTVNALVEQIELLLDGDETDAAGLGCEVGPVTRIAKEKSATSEDIVAIGAEVAGQFKAFASGGMVKVPATINFFECFVEQ